MNLYHVLAALVPWSVPLAALLVFSALAGLGVRRSWPYPSMRALLIVCLVIGMVSLVATLGDPDPEPSANAPHLAPEIRFAIVALLDALVLLAPAAAAFNVRREASVTFRALCAVVAGVVAAPIAAGAGLFLSCLFGLGCL